jgi:uncharacterized protein (DUF1810 family)
MMFTPREAAHRAWVAVYKARGPAATHYAEFIRGFNEGAAYVMEQSLGPKVPTIDEVRELFCDQVKRRRWRNFFGNLLP